MTFETVVDVTGLDFIVNVETIDDENQRIADALDFDYLPLVGQFFNCAGDAISEFDTGMQAYYSGLRLAQMTTDSMAAGWNHAHGEMMWDYAITAERDEVDAQRNGWMH